MQSIQINGITKMWYIRVSNGNIYSSVYSSNNNVILLKRYKETF